MTHIRPANIKDSKTIAQLFDQYRIFYKQTSNILEAEKFISQRLQHKESEIFVAENQTKQIVGFVQLYPLVSSTRMQRLWLLNDLFVEEQCRGKGISKQLIQVAKKLCYDTHACGLILETAKTNIVGNKLYPQTGFTLDTEHNYYSWDK